MFFFVQLIIVNFFLSLVYALLLTFFNHIIKLTEFIKYSRAK
jgi:hypothetical protein